MVIGLDVFKRYFEAYPKNYVIIGGTACDLIIDEAGFVPRATKDIDIILVVEALTSEFVKQFWKFIEDGNYERREKNEDDRKYYRFLKPKNHEFPFQIELFSRNPDLIDLDGQAYLTPIPVDDDLTSLSAILMDDDYYHYMLEHCTLKDGLQCANTEALMCLKVKAYLEIAERIVKGSTQETKKLRKHKMDVFRLEVILVASDEFELPKSIKADLQAFVNTISGKLPDKAIFKAMGLSGISVESVFKQIIKSFQLNE